MDYRNSKLNERYQNDAYFHTLVVTLEKMISHHGFTPSELREAVFLAHYKYEMENPHAIKKQVALSMSEIYNYSFYNKEERE